MELQKMIAKIAARYGLQPEQLEAGAYPPDQMKVLIRLFNKAMNSGKRSDQKIYLEQKAKYLLLANRRN